MDKKVIKKLNQLNKEFYAKTSLDFDDSRQYYWTGWEKLVPYFKNGMKILDVGCGNGRFYEFIKSKGFDVEYVGVDSSSELLALARNRYPEASWQELDIVNGYKKIKDRYDLIVSFGVFHHIPSFELRKNIIDHLSQLGAVLAISFWQFPKLKNLMKRQVLFNEVGLTKSDVEENDYLLDWQRGEKALRFCHYVDKAEVMRLMLNSKTYYADGKNKETNLYAILLSD